MDQTDIQIAVETLLELDLLSAEEAENWQDKLFI